MKLVFLGDSLTWGGYGGNFVQHVITQCPEHEIINAGVGGDTVINLLYRLEEVLDQYEPDAMFIMVGGNDAVSYLYPSVRPYYQTTKKIPGGVVTPDDFLITYRELITQLQLRFIHPFIGLAPTEYNRELVLTKRSYNNAVRELATTLHLPLLDLDALFTPEQPIEREGVSLAFIRQIGERGKTGWQDYEKEQQRWGYTYTFDGMHLTPSAAIEFANHIVSFLRMHLP